jgi:hypothetical protein
LIIGQIAMYELKCQREASSHVSRVHKLYSLS